MNTQTWRTLKIGNTIRFLSIFVVLCLLVYYSVWSADRGAQIHGPSRMVAGPENSIYVMVDGSLIRASSSGEVLADIKLKREYSVPDPIADLYVEPSGEIILGIANSQKIIRLSPDGRELVAYPFKPFSPPPGYLPYFKFTKNPAAGIFYLSDSHANTLRLFNQEDGEIAVWKRPRDAKEVAGDETGNKDPAATSFFWPNRVDYYQNYLFVVDTNNERVLRLQPDGTLSKTIYPSANERTAFNRPTDLSVNGNTLFVISRTPDGEGGVISAIDMETDKRWRFDLNGAAFVTGGKDKTIVPEDILARENDLLVSDQNLMKIYRFSKEGKYLGVFGQESFLNVLRRTTIKQRFFQWGKPLSILCMIIVLLALWRKSRMQKKGTPHAAEPLTKGASLFQARVNRRTVVLVLLIAISASIALAWSAGVLPKWDVRYAVTPLLFLFPLLHAFFIFAPLLVVLWGSYCVFRKMRKTKRPALIGPIFVICILLLLAVTAMLSVRIPLLPDIITRPLANAMLYLGMGDHDLYIRLSRLGDRTSVPSLIEALRREQQGGLAEHNRNIILSALRSITRNDFGNNYTEWETWWAGNKNKTADDWKISGLDRAGYAVSGYPSRDAVAALIDAMAYAEPVPGAREYLVQNAETLLLKLPAEDVIEVIRNKLNDNSAVNTRIGIARALGALGNQVAVPFLKALLTDEDQIVRSMAVFSLNKIQRALIKAPAGHFVMYEISTGDYARYTELSPDRRYLYFATGFKITKLDLQTGKTVWAYNSQSEIGSELVAREREVLYYGYDGTVNCIDTTRGTLIWRYQSEGTTYRYHSKVVVAGDTAYMGVEHYVRAVDIESGRIKWSAKVLPSSGLITCLAGNVFVATREGQLLKITPGGKELGKVDIGGWPYSLEAYDGLLYVTYKSEPAYLKVFSSEKLELMMNLWIGQRFSSARIVVNETTVVIPENYRLTSFDRKKGVQRWSIEERDLGPISLSETLLATGDELRDPVTGALLHKYNIGRIAHTRLFESMYVVSDYAGKLFVLRLP